MLLSIKHTTIYRYNKPVALLPHRLMLTPRSSHHLDLEKPCQGARNPIGSLDGEGRLVLIGHALPTSMFGGAAANGSKVGAAVPLSSLEPQP